MLHAAELTLTLNAGDYKIIGDAKGQRIEMENSGYLQVPGEPMLPAQNAFIALPPGAIVRSVDITGTGAVELPDKYDIVPSPATLPLVDPYGNSEYINNINRQWQRNYDAVYYSDRGYPTIRGSKRSSGTLRKYSYVSVSFYPFGYHPQSGRLIYYSSALVTVSYDLPDPGTVEAQKLERLKWDTVADERAARLFVNYDQFEALYQPRGSQPDDYLTLYDYVIITHENLLNAINSSDLIEWKTSLGYNTCIVLTSDPEIADQPGDDLPARIRNFLMDYYGSWGIEYVLLIGNHATIPMRYCYPDPSNHSNGAGDPSNWPWAGDVPTDYYYADLSNPDILSWDSDNDGYPGEYGQDDPDLMAEVYVGRIPTNNTYRITYTLDKLAAFEQDTGDWKNNVLHAGAIAYYENDDHSGRELIDGAVLLNDMETDYMDGLTISHYSERGGLAPSEFEWSSLSEAAFIGDWRNGRYAVVNWYAHGWSDRVARKVWSWDDGDRVPESNEMWWPDIISINSNLDDDYPSIVFALSCMVGYPEPNSWGNMGIDLLTEPSYGASAGIVSGTRVVWVSVGGGELHSYEFSRFMIDGPEGPEKVGEALYDSKFYLSQNYNWGHYAEYWDLFTFNLYGDPALKREGETAPVSVDDTPEEIPTRFALYGNYPNPFNASTVIGYSLPEQSDVRIEIYNILGQKVATLFDGNKESGYHTITWHADTNPSAVYFARMQAGGYTESLRMTILK
jgi:hypothetical protein